MKQSILTSITFLVILLFSSISVSAQQEYSAKQEKVSHQTEAFDSFLYASPNPFQSYTFICFSSEKEGMYELEVLNKMGQRVIYKSGDAVYGKNKVKITRGGLQSGRYYYRLRIGHQSFKTGIVYISE